MPTFPRNLAADATASSASSAKFTRNDWIEFLVRIPAIDVVIFRRLSKFHRDLIDSPDFIRKHYDQSRKSTSTHVIVSQRTSTPNQTVDDCLRFDSSEASSKAEAWTRKETYFDLKLNLMKDASVAKKGYTVAGSCRGILCLTQGLHHVILWNPITRDARTFISDNIDSDTYPFFTYYLGHDALTDDMKVLKISHKHNHETVNRHYEYVCEVYSSKNSSWTKVSRKNHNRIQLIHLSNGGVFVEGTNSLHFLVKEMTRGSVAAFDLATEKFRRVRLPDGSWANDLHCLNGRLCFSQTPEYPGPEEQCFSVWRMEEYGVQESWSRILSIETCSRLQLGPVDFVNDGRHLLVLTRLRSRDQPEIRLWFYDCLEKRMIENQISVTPPKLAEAVSRAPMRFLYTPSLIQL